MRGPHGVPRQPLKISPLDEVPMLSLTVNGVPREISSAPDTPLLYVLRNELRVNAAKYGCGLGQCGACTVMVDGEAIFSCITPVMLVQNRKVVTLEGLGTLEQPGEMQRAFIEEQAAQCGYCIPGMMMRAQALLDREPNASEDRIRAELEPHLCRCGTHMRILRAVSRAAAALRKKHSASSRATP
jgi:nicotinate dehydrogenase subunit A